MDRTEQAFRTLTRDDSTVEEIEARMFLRAELAGMRADAERYRWLRLMQCTDRYSLCLTNPKPSDLDTALDRTRSATHPEQTP